MKKFIAAVILVIVGVFGAPAAAHAAYPTPSGPTTGAPGATLNYTFTGIPDATVSITSTGDVTLAATVVKSVSGGSASVAATFPSTGSYTITATGDSGYLAAITVRIAAAPSDGLADTGVDATPYLWFGGGLLVLGVALIVVLTVVRRNKVTTPTV